MEMMLIPNEVKVGPTDLLRPEHPRRGEGVALPEGEAGGGRVPPAGQQTLPAEALHEGGGRGRQQTHLAHAKVAAGGRRCHSHPIILTPNWDTRSLSLSQSHSKQFNTFLTSAPAH